MGVASLSCPSTYTTINAAISAVPAGATIYVCAGTYAEAVSVSKNITLLGAQYGVSATTGRTDPSQETIIESPSGADVTYSGASTGTLSGFSLVGNGKAVGDNNGILAIAPGQSGYTWTDNIITGTSTGINFRADGSTPTTISGNRISDNTEAGGSQQSNGIFFTNGPADNVTISGNLFGSQGADLNTTGQGSAAALSQNLRVTNNTSVNSSNFALLFLTNNAVVSNNTIRWTNPHDPGAGSAILVYGGNSNPTVSANTIRGGAATAIRVDAAFYGPSSAVTIADNAITNRLNGVRVDANAALTSTSSITNNVVTNAGVGDGVSPTVIGGNGIWLQGGTGVVVTGNTAFASVTTDCRDSTSGTGTAGTANTWTANTGATSSPPGLCLQSAPAITIVKSSTTKLVSTVGQVVPYNFLVTNTGNVALTKVTVHDTQIAPALALTSGPTCPAAASLAPRASVTCTATYTISQADLENGSVKDSATATGTPPSGPPVNTSPSKMTILAAATPSLHIVKSTTATGLHVGETVPYRFLVTNVGNVTLTNVMVKETAFSGSGKVSTPACPAAAASLAPGAPMVCTATYVVTQADLNARVVNNTAEAIGTPPHSGTSVISNKSSATSSRLAGSAGHQPRSSGDWTGSGQGRHRLRRQRPERKHRDRAGRRRRDTAGRCRSADGNGFTPQASDLT